jgi:hypothetical protein
MNVKIFRLNSGEELISRFEETPDFWILKNTAILIPMGQGQIGMMPWLVYTKAGINIPKSYVAFTVDPIDEMKDQYDQNLNTGLVTPSKAANKSPGFKLTM